MTVTETFGFGLKKKKLPSETEVKKQVEDILRNVNLDHTGLQIP
jgi:ABC-type sulfate/molybdate transport systems ATPase subunit